MVAFYIHGSSCMNHCQEARDLSFHSCGLLRLGQAAHGLLKAQGNLKALQSCLSNRLNELMKKKKRKEDKNRDKD